LAELSKLPVIPIENQAPSVTYTPPGSQETDNNPLPPADNVKGNLYAGPRVTGSSSHGNPSKPFRPPKVPHPVKAPKKKIVKPGM